MLAMNTINARSHEPVCHSSMMPPRIVWLSRPARVLAVAMIGTREAQPIGQAMPKLFMPITVRFGQPIDPARFATRADDPLVLRQLTDEVMFELRALTGQEYVDRYAKRKADVGEDMVEPARIPTTPTTPTTPQLATAG